MTINKLHPIFIQGFLDSIIDDVQDKEVSQITVGLITSYKDCVATVVGLDNAMSGELVYVVSQDTQESQNETTENTETFKDLATEISIGMVFNLQEDQVGILILEVSTKGVKEGDIVYGTDMLPSVKFSPNTFGKIINH